MMISLLSMAANFILNWALVGVLQERGLALSTSVVAIMNFALLYAIMRRRVGGIEGRATALAVLKIVTASAAMGVVCWALSGLIARAAGSGFPARAVNVLVSVAVGAVVFWIVAAALGLTELRSITTAIAQRLRGRTRRS